MKNLYFSFLFILLIIPFQSHQAQRRNKKVATTSYKESLYNGMKWRQLGPFRGGRAGTATGVTNNPNLYYMGTAGGGVWKTTDAGSTWECISDGYFGGLFQNRIQILFMWVRENKHSEEMSHQAMAYGKVWMPEKHGNLSD